MPQVNINIFPRLHSRLQCISPSLDRSERNPATPNHARSSNLYSVSRGHLRERTICRLHSIVPQEILLIRQIEPFPRGRAPILPVESLHLGVARLLSRPVVEMVESAVSHRAGDVERRAGLALDFVEAERCRDRVAAGLTRGHAEEVAEDGAVFDSHSGALGLVGQGWVTCVTEEDGVVLGRAVSCLI